MDKHIDLSEAERPRPQQPKPQEENSNSNSGSQSEGDQEPSSIPSDGDGPESEENKTREDEGSDWTISLPSDSEGTEVSKKVDAEKSIEEERPESDPAIGNVTARPRHEQEIPVLFENHLILDQGDRFGDEEKSYIVSACPTLRNLGAPSINRDPRIPLMRPVVHKRIGGFGLNMVKVEGSGVLEDPFRKRQRLSFIQSSDSSSDDDESNLNFSSSVLSKLSSTETSEFTAGIHQRNDLYCDLSELWKSKDFADIVFECSDGIVKAHKLIVSARSDVFRAMFDSGMLEASSNTVKIEDIKLGTMKILLEYIYTGCVNPLSTEEMSALLRAADKYQMNKLKTACFQLLIGKMKIKNTGDLIMLAHIHCASNEIKHKIQEYVLRMRSELWEVPEFISLVEQNPLIFVTFVFESYKCK